MVRFGRYGSLKFMQTRMKSLFNLQLLIKLSFFLNFLHELLMSFFNNYSLINIMTSRINSDTAHYFYCGQFPMRRHIWGDGTGYIYMTYKPLNILVSYIKIRSN
jgi:hypothetical protein